MPFESASSWTFFLRGGLALLHLRTCLDASRVFPSALPKDDDGLFLCSDCLLDSASFYSLGFYFYWGRARETQSRRRNGSGEKKKKKKTIPALTGCVASRVLSPPGVYVTLSTAYYYWLSTNHTHVPRIERIEPSSRCISHAN